MVVLCTTSALAVENTLLYSFRVYYVDGERYRFTGTTPYTFTGNETTFEFSAGMALTQNGEDIMAFAPFNTYSGVINLTTTSSIPDVFTLSTKFFLLKKTATDGADYSQYQPLSGVVVTKTITQTETQNPATLRTTYSLNFAFRLEDSFDPSEYYYLAIRCPITPNLYEAGDWFLIDSVRLVRAENQTDLGSIVESMLSEMAAQGAATREAVEDAVGSVVTAVNSGAENIWDAIADLQDIESDLLQQGYSIEDAIELMGINIHSDFSDFYNDFTTWQANHDQQLLEDEDSITQQRANRGQQEAEQTFNVDSLKTGLTSLFNSLNYTGTSFSLRFPAAHDVPYLGDLWDSQRIPLKEWIDQLPSTVLYAARFVFIVGFLLSVLWHVKDLINMIGGNDK